MGLYTALELAEDTHIATNETDTMTTYGFKYDNNGPSIEIFEEHTEGERLFLAFMQGDEAVILKDEIDAGSRHPRVSDEQHVQYLLSAYDYTV